jgi:hypothetical protein
MYLYSREKERSGSFFFEPLIGHIKRVDVIWPIVLQNPFECRHRRSPIRCQDHGSWPKNRVNACFSLMKGEISTHPIYKLIIKSWELITRDRGQMLSVYCSTMWYNTTTMSILSTEMGLIFSRITTQVVDLLGGLLHWFVWFRFLISHVSFQSISLSLFSYGLMTLCSSWRGFTDQQASRSEQKAKTENYHFWGQLLIPVSLLMS